MKEGIQLQREYYTRTAANYDDMHVQSDGEHDISCVLMAAFAHYYGLRSILDVGSGTGRAISMLSEKLPDRKIIGIEPVQALRDVGHAKGLAEESLIDGDATQIKFPDSSFDLVCELGVLHHVPNPRKAVSEMIRVSSKAIYLSDSNRFGHGSILGKRVKLLLWKLGLWPLANYFKTRGAGYTYGEGDGVAYSYSVFDDFDYISTKFDKVMVFNLDGTGKAPVFGAPHVGVFAYNKK
jgi:SAM-dependent methyltransferase